MAYLLRKPRKNGATHLVMTPVQLLARISAIIPPPRFPLLRFAGVLAPRSPFRSAVVAMRPAKAEGGTGDARGSARPKKTKKTTTAKSETDVREPTPPAPSPPRTSLGAGVVTPVGSRIDWATLLRRTYLDDVLACPCGGRRYVVADIDEPGAIVAILTHLGLDTEPPPVARARAPDDHAA